MPIPQHPANLIPRVFASNGNSTVIPDAKSGSGRASWQEGFPTETQLPLSNGGIAPSRIDFNGLFQMLSALAFWQQSGGLMVYSSKLNYNTPSVVYHAVENVGRLWWCLMPNGPDTVTPGVVAPGTNSGVWLDLWDWLRGGSSGGGGSTITATGYLTEFRSFYEQAPPEAWAIRNGQILTSADVIYPDLWAALQLSANSWKLKTDTAWQALSEAAGYVGGVPYFVLDTVAKTIRLPDTRGDYERCAGGGTMASVGHWHEDAIQNIKGTLGEMIHSEKFDGAFKLKAYVATRTYPSGPYASAIPDFDASRVVRTADENRTRAFGVLGCVYIGKPVA